MALMIIRRLRMPEEFVKAMALRADADAAAAASNSAMQGVGCMAAHIYNSNYCPVDTAKHE